jgi:[ribosomal protein S5]-alanine N-acetyltransferase
MNNNLETKRLFLRELSLDDAIFIFRLLNTEGWLKFIGNRNIVSLGDAKNYIKNGPLVSYKMHGFGLLLVIEKSSNKPIGLCGLLQRDYLDNPDIGFAFLPEFSKMGYAFEAADAVMGQALEVFGKKILYATVMNYNHSSIKLLLKLGFTFQKVIVVNNEELDLYQFEQPKTKV